MRTPKRAVKEPKEDGEVGETIADLLTRHGVNVDGKLRSMVDELYDNVDVFTPQCTKMVHRMLSAALSPMPHKTAPEEAMEALDTFKSEHLPQRRQQRKKAKALQAVIEEQAEEITRRFVEEVLERKLAVLGKRALGSPEPMQRKKRNNFGDLVAP